MSTLNRKNVFYFIKQSNCRESGHIINVELMYRFIIIHYLYIYSIFK